MALPAVAVTVNYYDGTGAPLTTGSAVFTPTCRVTLGSGVQQVARVPVEVELGPAGLPVVTLVPTDAPGSLPAGWGWQVSFDGVPGAPEAFTFFAPQGPVAFTAATGLPGIFTWTATAGLATLPNGTGITLTGSPPAPLAAGTVYYVTGAAGQTFRVAATPGGAALTLTAPGSGQLSVASYFLSGLAPARVAPALSPYLFTPAGTAAAGLLPVATGNPGEARWTDVTASFSAPGFVRRTVYNVMDGAAGDGTTDDTAAFQGALNAAAAGSKVWAPYRANGYKCGAITVPPGVELAFDKGARLIAPSSLAAPWIVAQQGVAHNGTAVTGGTFDASAVTSALCTHVIKFNGMPSCPNIRIERNRIVNAPKHGIQFGGEANPTLGMKWVCGNSVEEHGTAGTGFGIYGEYVGSGLIEANYVFTAGQAGVFGDNIELGHSGPAWLPGGLVAHLRCHNNTVVGGQINYPFSDYAEITSNTVLAGNGPGGIQNDGNTANYVQIRGNRVFGATPGSQFAGISNWGTDPQITDNYVQVASGNGIGGSFTNATVNGNKIYSTSASASGWAIYPGGGGTGNVIEGNTASGLFNYAIHMPFTGSVVKGNTFNTVNGLDFSNCHGSVVTGNTVAVTGTPYSGQVGTGTIFRDNPGIPEYTAVTGTYAMQPADYVAEATSGTFTITLPTASGFPGDKRTVKNSGTGVITLNSVAAQPIDGVTTATIPAGGSLTVYSDGTAWKKIGSYP